MIWFATFWLACLGFFLELVERAPVIEDDSFPSPSMGERR